MANKMTDAEYGKKVREQSKKYWLRYKAIQTLKEEALKGWKPTEDQIKAQMTKDAVKK